MCTHSNARFLACSAADRFPGVWFCDKCGEKFNFDPLGRTSIKYLDHPNPRLTKVITFTPERNPEKMRDG